MPHLRCCWQGRGDGAWGWQKSQHPLLSRQKDGSNLRDAIVQTAVMGQKDGGGLGRSSGNKPQVEVELLLGYPEVPGSGDGGCKPHRAAGRAGGRGCRSCPPCWEGASRGQHLTRGWGSHRGVLPRAATPSPAASRERQSGARCVAEGALGFFCGRGRRRRDRPRQF